jgi:polysaccharide export outer membrane protein
MIAVGKTPTALARDIEAVLSEFIVAPMVNVIVRATGGASMVQVVGGVVAPQGIVFREGVRVLDVIVAAGGLTEFAAGNRAMIVRPSGSGSIECRVRLEDLIDDGDISQNVLLRAGDVIVVPESSF